MNKFIIFIAFFSSASLAFFPLPPLPNMPPILPLFDNANPARFFNQWTSQKPDFVREKRVVEQIEDAILNGEVVRLNTKNNGKVFAIWTEAESEKAKGGVIVLHSRAMNPNWGTVIQPVRVGVAEVGWESLSVQMPLLHNKAKYYDYVGIFPYAHERIWAAIDFYQKRGINKIVLIAHACGAHMAMSFMDKYGDKMFAAYVGIGMGATDYKQKIVKPYPSISVPFLDIFAEKDYPGVIRTALKRSKLLAKKPQPKSAQLMIKKSDHYYQSEEHSSELVSKINHWLDKI